MSQEEAREQIQGMLSSETFNAWLETGKIKFIREFSLIFAFNNFDDLMAEPPEQEPKRKSEGTSLTA